MEATDKPQKQPNLRKKERKHLEKIFERILVQETQHVGRTLLLHNTLFTEFQLSEQLRSKAQQLHGCCLICVESGSEKTKLKVFPIDKNLTLPQIQAAFEIAKIHYSTDSTNAFLLVLEKANEETIGLLYHVLNKVIHRQGLWT